MVKGLKKRKKKKKVKQRMTGGFKLFREMSGTLWEE